MMNSVFTALSLYGFESRYTWAGSPTMVGGAGSLASGFTVEVLYRGNDTYRVRLHSWYWDGGDYEEEHYHQWVCHGNEVFDYALRRR